MEITRFTKMEWMGNIYSVPDHLPVGEDFTQQPFMVLVGLDDQTGELIYTASKEKRDIIDDIRSPITQYVIVGKSS